MKNILSYEYGTKFTGKEIHEWAQFQIKNNTSHVKYAKIILKRFKNLKPEKLYSIKTSYQGTASGEVIHKPLVKK